MKPKTILLLILLLVALGVWGVRLRAHFSAARHEAARTAEMDAFEPLPVIDFPMLDQARPLDLIDMELDFPESLKELEGRRVSLVGFMAPFDSLGDMRRCMVVPSYVGCNFCSPPHLTQVVYVTQGRDDEPGSFQFIEAPSRVRGTLRLSRPGSDHEGQRQGFIYSIEDAVVTPYTGSAVERAAGHGAAPHELSATPLAPVALADLVRQVADLLGREPLRPIEFETVSDGAFGDRVRAGLEATFPDATRTARSRALTLLGLLPEDAALIDALAEFQLARLVAEADESGGRIYVLDSVPVDHPYVRLELVGEIAEALTRQHFPRHRTETGADHTEGGLEPSDDARRARAALRQGIRMVAVDRYAVSHGISPAVQPPAEFIEQSADRRRAMKGMERTIASVEFRLWQSMPESVGPFFVEFLVGATGSIADVDAAFARPPSTTMEFLRPRWYQDTTLWRRDPVPIDFADDRLETAPVLTDVLGVGSLIPLLAKWYPIEGAKHLAGGWAGDRWALWQFPDGTSALMLEIRWQDEASAIEFREAIPGDSSWRLPPHEAGSTRVRMLRADSGDAIDRLNSAVQTVQ